MKKYFAWVRPKNTTDTYRATIFPASNQKEAIKKLKADGYEFENTPVWSRPNCKPILSSNN